MAPTNLHHCSPAHEKEKTECCTKNAADKSNGMFAYLSEYADSLRDIGRQRCSETITATLRSFMRFRKNVDLKIQDFNDTVAEKYETYLLNTVGVTRNTSSFYMRNLRSAYQKAVEKGLTTDQRPFRRVYTGIDKTSKRAIGKEYMSKIKELDLSGKRHLQFAQDMLLLSFFLRGMPFIDMAYLKKKDLNKGYINYKRKKTRQHLTIEWTAEMQKILDRYKNDSQYLLPIITKEDGTERLQYQSQLSKLNRNLKTIGKIIGLKSPLTSYTSRHSWATIAYEMDIPISIISQGLGHNSERTTQIYLKSIKSSAIDKANQMIINSL